jgi:hypothetical protein
LVLTVLSSLKYVLAGEKMRPIKGIYLYVLTILFTLILVLPTTALRIVQHVYGGAYEAYFNDAFYIYFGSLVVLLNFGFQVFGIHVFFVLNRSYGSAIETLGKMKKIVIMAFGTLFLSIAFCGTIVIGIVFRFQENAVAQLIYEAVLHACQFGAFVFMFSVNCLLRTAELAEKRLQDTMADGFMRERFHAFCQKEHSDENVLFWKVRNTSGVENDWDRLLLSLRSLKIIMKSENMDIKLLGNFWM